MEIVMAGTNTSSAEQRREIVRKSVNKHRARLRDLTKLELAAYEVRERTSAGFEPYTPRERQEAEAIRAEIERVVRRAELLNQEINKRLERSGNPDHAVLHEVFKEAVPTRIMIAPF